MRKRIQRVQVECNWCFWNGNRQKKHFHVRCPKCRKSHTVELFDPNKKYSDEEHERHRKFRMIEWGAKEIRSGAWISTKPKIYANRNMDRLKEFEDYHSLYRLLKKEWLTIWISRAWRKGKKFVKIGDMYIKTGRK